MIGVVSRTTKPESVTLPRFSDRRNLKEFSHQAYIPAQEALPPSRARFPAPHEHARGSSCDPEPTSQGPPAADQLGPRPGEEALPAPPDERVPGCNRR